MMCVWRSVISLLLLCIGLCLSQNPLTAINPCIGRKTCSECLVEYRSCAWCQTANYDTENKERCNIQSEHTNCPPDDLIFPSSVLDRKEDEPTRDGSSTTNAIQVQPQVINLKLRPNDPQKFTLNFRLANNYPVDLYYLMDLSYSMKDDKETLAKLGLKIAEEMNNITDSLRLGFGSFIDKRSTPFVRTEPDMINKPCTGCEPPYGFKNHLELSDNPSVFEEKVAIANVSGSLDAPEGGSDAIMQAITCEKEIGWRKFSRRLLLYSTDAGFHFAGDGRLGGIIKPNDEECHLVNNMYTEDTKQDYPSVSQIAAKTIDQNINLIFAVTNNQIPAYSQLQNFIPGSETGQLADDSSNIVELAREIYNKITSKVMLTSVGAENVIIRYFSSCNDHDGELRETNVCEGLKVGDSINFEVEFELKECPKDVSSYSRKFYIKPLGLSDRLEVRLEQICQCDCENSTALEQNKLHPNCSNHGMFVCGTCDCESKYYGKNCNCFIGNGTTTDDEEACKSPNSTSICSGQGDCICGTCECKSRHGNSREKYSGEWCQCDDYGCPFYNNELCGGHTNGICECNKCKCTSGFSGEDCSCSTRNDSCIATDGSLCGGPEKGQCVCNKCVCNTGSKYHGPTCEDCIQCQLACRQNKECVQCVAYGTGKKKDKCEECKADNYISVVDVLAVGYNRCEFKDDDDCIFYFTYNYTERNELTIMVQRTKECPTEVDPKPIIIGVVVSVVVIGLALLLIWKIYTTISDSRELARFNREKKDARWETGENPMYRPATTSFENPTFTTGI